VKPSCEKTTVNNMSGSGDSPPVHSDITIQDFMPDRFVKFG